MSDTRLFVPASDTPEAATGRWEQSKQSMHDWIDGFPGLTDAERTRRKAEYDLQHGAGLAASGLIPPPPKTPAEVAEARFEQQYSMPEMPPGLSELLENQIEQIEAAPHTHARLAGELAQHYGPARYAAIIAEAQAGVNEPLTPAMKLSRHLLDVLSVFGRANIARDNAIAARGR